LLARGEGCVKVNIFHEFSVSDEVFFVRNGAVLGEELNEASIP